MTPFDLYKNPLIRMVGVIIAIAAGIRLIFELLYPVMPYLLTGFIGFAIFRFVNWRRGRW